MPFWSATLTENLTGWNIFPPTLPNNYFVLADWWAVPTLRLDGFVDLFGGLVQRPGRLVELFGDVSQVFGCAVRDVCTGSEIVRTRFGGRV